MRLLGWIVLVLTALGLAVVTTACHPAAVPGTSAGTFAVSETLTTNGCAGGFDPDAMLSYTTDIRVEGEIAYWHRGDTPIASGTYSTDGHFHFVSQVDIIAYGNDAGPGGPPGCSLREIETIDGMLLLGARDAGASEAGSSDAHVDDLDAGSHDAGVHSTGFVGTDTVQLSIAPGSDCSALFASNGGPFNMLPCTASFDMSATAN